MSYSNGACKPLNVWTYWEGPRPEYINLCLDSVRSVCDAIGTRFHLVMPQSVEGHLPGNDCLHRNYRKLGDPALRADCIRAALLATHGGFWWDADTIGWNNPMRVLRAHPDASAIYTVWDKPPRRVLNGYIYFEPDSPIAQEWLSRINYRLKYEFHAATWCGYGENLLTPLLSEDPRAVQVPRATFLPIDIDSSVPTFFEPGDPLAHATPDTVCYGLNHSWFIYHCREQIEAPAGTWSSSPLLIHRLLSHARSMLC